MARTEPARAYVSLGSNVMRRYHLRAAITAFERCFGILHVSRVYESPALGFKGPPFYNLVCGFSTALQPVALARVLHALERRHGRRRTRRRYTSRTLDLDLLLYANRTCRRQAGPTLPHPDLATRSFVLCPLAELAGETVDPRSGQRITALWQRFRGGPRLSLAAFQLG